MTDAKVATMSTNAEVRRLPLPTERENPFGPAPEVAQLRAAAPVTQVLCPTGIQAWLVTRYEDVREVLANPQLFSSRPGPAAHILAHMRPDDPIPEGMFARMDGSDHMRYRRAIGPELTRVRRIEQLAPAVQEVVDERIDALARTTGPVDLHTSVAAPVTTAVIAELLGVPAADRQLFQDAASALFSMDSDVEKIAAAVAPLFEYLHRLVTARRAEPGDDVISHLIGQGEGTDRPFTDAELMISASTLLVAGFDSTASVISYGLLALLAHPDQLALLRDDPSLMPTAIEELIRFLGTVVGLLRVATVDTEIAGQPIAAGEFVVASVHSANRDQTRYDDGDRLDITRKPNPHLAFGFGPHQCIGQQLARLELKIVLDTLLRRLSGLRLAVPIEQIEFREGTAVTGPVALPVTWDAIS
jgi:cytochrome P450